METAYLYFARCSLQRWWNRTAHCRQLPSWNIPGIPWSVAPHLQLLDVRACGPPRCSRHGIAQWVTPWWNLISVDWVSWWRRLPPFPLTWRSRRGACGATILHTNFQKTCNPRTWAGTLHPWCRAGAISKALSDIGHVTSGPGCCRWTKGGIVQHPYHSRIVFHSWMSMWWSNLVSEPDPSEMEVVNLLRVDWFHHSGSKQGLHQWDRRSLTSRRNWTKQFKCPSLVVRRIVPSQMSYSTESDSA